jgi:hypothetical protein
MLLLTILGYYSLFHLKIFLIYYRLFHPRLFLAILNNYNIWLLVVILLMAIGYFFIGAIGGY